MAAINFINDKFTPPVLPEICIPRRDLYKLYQQANVAHLGAVCAPAGYGKTVSALLWSRETKRQTLWIGLDKYDNAPALFYALFCTGILSTQPDNLPLQQRFNNSAFKTDPIAQTMRLLSDLPPDKSSYTLILDDFHAITNAKIINALPYILKRLPHSFTVLLLSRGHLPEPLDALLKTRHSSIISSHQLAFSARETQAYYAGYGRDLSEIQTQLILEKTAGWPLGLQTLAHADSVETPQDYETIINDYITQNIWPQWSAELQSTMLVSAVADEFDSALLSLLMDRKNISVLLAKLINQNAFLTRTPHNSYCYQPLFLNFLRAKLKAQPTLDVQTQNLKIADLYFERQDFFSALDYYIRAENLNGINRSFYLLNTLFMDYSVGEWLYQFTTLVQDRLAEEIIQNDPPLLVEYAWANFLNGNAKATLRYIDRINACLTEATHLATIRESNLIGAIGIIRFADFRQNICSYSKDFSELVKFFPDDHQVKLYSPSITQNFPIMHRSIFDCLEIIPDLDNRLQSIKDAFGFFFPQEVDLFCRCVKAGLYYEINDLENAYETIAFTQRLQTKETRFEMQFCVAMIRSLILHALDKKSESERVRMNFRRQIQSDNGQYLYPNFSAIDIRQRLWDGDRKAAQTWLDESFTAIDEPLRFYKIYQYFTTARAYIVLAKQTEALKLLGQLKNLSADYHRPLDLAEANILKATLEWATGSKKAALQNLEAVLIVLQPYRSIRIIGEEGTSVLPMLKKLTTKTSQSDYSGPLDPHYLKQVYLCAYQVSKTHVGITAHLNEKSVKLSKQQKYILSLLAAGYSTTEIVTITERTINTVKSHTKMIYLKLDVHNAADAVLKAKQLGLLESSI